MAKRKKATRALTSLKKDKQYQECAQIFDERLSLASTTSIARFSKGLQHDPTTGEVSPPQFANSNTFWKPPIVVYPSTRIRMALARLAALKFFRSSPKLRREP